MWYRSNTLRVLCPVIFIATRSGTPALTMFRTAVLRKSCRNAPGTPAAPQRHGPGQRSFREDIDQHPREDEVLLDHGIIGPRCDLSPGHDVGPGDHAIPWSGSTSSLTARRQRRLRGAPVMVWVGSSGTMRGALLATQSASGLAGSARPTSSRR